MEKLLSEYRPGVDDWIWSSTDPLELAGRAITLIQSPTERQALAERQNAYVQDHHTAKVMALAYSRLYQKMIDRNETKPNIGSQ